MINVLAFIGAIALLVILLFLLVLSIDFMRNVIAKIKWKYKYKHRFDKKPVAKCYCKDCIYYKKSNFTCDYDMKGTVSENSFCSKASPASRDPEKIRYY